MRRHARINVCIIILTACCKEIFGFLFKVPPFLNCDMSLWWTSIYHRIRELLRLEVISAGHLVQPHAESSVTGGIRPDSHTLLHQRLKHLWLWLTESFKYKHEFILKKIINFFCHDCSYSRTVSLNILWIKELFFYRKSIKQNNILLV